MVIVSQPWVVILELSVIVVGTGDCASITVTSSKMSRVGYDNLSHLGSAKGSTGTRTAASGKNMVPTKDLAFSKCSKNVC